MNGKVKVSHFAVWLGLFAYLFIGLSTSQVALAFSSVFADPHELIVVTDGNHQDIILGHQSIKYHQSGHSHAHSHAHKHEGLNASIHSQPHPDHVFHLSEKHEQLTVQAPAIQLNCFQYLYALTLPTAVVRAMDFFLKEVSIQAWPQPPPRIALGLVLLRTIILII